MGFTFFRFSEMKRRPTTAPSSFLPRLHRLTAKLEKRGTNHLLIRNLFIDQIRSNHIKLHQVRSSEKKKTLMAMIHANWGINFQTQIYHRKYLMQSQIRSTDKVNLKSISLTVLLTARGNWTFIRQKKKKIIPSIENVLTNLNVPLWWENSKFAF